MQIDTRREDSTKSDQVQVMENQLDNLVQQLKLIYQMEAAKYKYVQTETIAHAVNQLPPNILNMKMCDFIDQCEDVDFNRLYNVKFELQDP